MKILTSLTLSCLLFNAAAAEPFTYETAISLALRNNPDIRLAQHRIAAAKEGLVLANAAFMPQLQVQSSYVRTDNPVAVFGYALNQRSFSFSGIDFNDVPDADNFNAKGLVTVPLYAGGKNVAGRAAAKANASASKQDAEAVRNALAFETGRAFLTVLKTREFIRATQAGVQSFETNLDTATKRMQNGTLLKSDVLDVEVRLAQAREDLVRAQNANTLALRTLRNLLGIEKGDIEVADTAPALDVPKTQDFSRRSELAAIYLRQQAAEAEVRRAKAGYYPQLNAMGSVDYDHGWKFNGEGKSYTAGVVGQWMVWDGFSTRAKVHEAEANLESAREQERKIRLAIDLEVEQGRLALKEATERLTVTERVVAQATESVHLTRVRFAQGLAIPTQMIDADTALISARVRRAEAENEQRIAVAALRKALGLGQIEMEAAGK
jgi:outer membrane protein TolC